MNPQETPTEEESRTGSSIQERREQEAGIWRSALVISVGLHLLLFLLWPTGGGPDSPFSAPGPREMDTEAAEGFMRTVSLSSAPADALQPPPTPTVDVELPEPPEVDPEASPEVDLEEPEVPEPGVGRGIGEDEADAPTGLAGASGSGDAGTGEEGLTRLIPPTPRGMIIPPTNRSLRGTEVEVWVFVDEGGRVVADSTRLDPPTSDRNFNNQLMREAAQWIFQPAQRGGDAVAAWFPYTISM